MDGWMDGWIYIYVFMYKSVNSFSQNWLEGFFFYNFPHNQVVTFPEKSHSPIFEENPIAPKWGILLQYGVKKRVCCVVGIFAKDFSEI